MVSGYVDAVLRGTAGDFAGSGIQPLFADTVFCNACIDLAAARSFKYADFFPDWTVGDPDRIEL